MKQIIKPLVIITFLLAILVTAIFFSHFNLVGLLESSSSVPNQADTNSPPTSVSIPVIMYHGVTDKSEQVNTYFIDVRAMADDLKYLKENQYTTVTINDLIHFVNEPSAVLPPKPVVLTFDDGYYNNHKFVTPLLKKYGMRAVISIIGIACQKTSDEVYRSENFCNLTWKQVKEIYQSGLWEIQNHTYNMHETTAVRKGAQRGVYESEENYHKALTEDLLKLQGKLIEITGEAPTTFTWPFGAASAEALLPLKKMGFQATLSCYDGISEIKKGDPSSLFHLKRKLRTPGTSIRDLL